ncbi:efflux RND transporter periplasmic adaptor subunit [Schinkia sp. CFF1]
MVAHLKWIISGVLALGIGGYYVYSAAKPLDVELLAVKPQTVAQAFKEEGIVTAAIERPVYSVTTGKVTSIPVKEGQAVKKGDLLIEMESKDLEYQLQQLKAQKLSLQGQEKMTSREMKQQLGQLQGQLDSIKGQEKQANKSPYNAQLAQQELVIAETKRELAITKGDLQKVQKLYDNGAASKKELDDAKDKVEQFENSLKQQEQALKLIKEQAVPLPGTNQYYSGLKDAIAAQIDILKSELNGGATGTSEYYHGLIEVVDAQINHLDYLIGNNKISAPIDGIIKGVMTKEGEVVSTQAPLITLQSNESLEVEVYLLTEDVLNVKERMPVTLIQKRKNGDYSFDGTVKAIAPAAEEKVSALGLTEQKVKVTIALGAKAPELRPGYALDVQFTTLEQRNKLAVPKVVLFPDGKAGDAVWVVKGGKAMMQGVKTGMETDELVVIEKGLKAGDKVIKNPQLEGLQEGKKVK